MNARHQPGSSLRDATPHAKESMASEAGKSVDASQAKRCACCGAELGAAEIAMKSAYCFPCADDSLEPRPQTADAASSESAGREAYAAGVKLKNCPFAPYSKSAGHWCKGWRRARREANNE